ncbi:MAG TPA: hypothetical protein VGJ00_10435 [Rhabdochlamydiaceae bacterium]|jgi:hypothetical protein
MIDKRDIQILKRLDNLNTEIEALKNEGEYYLADKISDYVIKLSTELLKKIKHRQIIEKQ